MTPIEKLKSKLAELFQLDQADLDFGIYRIMNAKRDEITRFLDKDLLPQVEEAFKQYKSSDKADIRKELDKVIEGIKAAGMDPDASPKVKDLQRRLSEDAVDIVELQNEVFSHLYSFFSRYYDEGDFISLRRYKEGVYAIPYEGEEVKLHWANHDQYYIKTTENFRDYVFRLIDGRRVHFKIVEADTEKDNIKAASGNDRRFILIEDKPVAEESGELVIRFEYRADADKRKQDDLNAEAVKSIMGVKGILTWQKAFEEKWRRANGELSDKTILGKHLDDYTKRNTFDYFIHKHLGRFLRQELDFYIKNEVMHLDDVEDESAPRVEQYLSKIRVIRKIAHKVIDFLGQLEDFQKRLWLKKKFVIETNYCITLDRVPEELYPEIAKNDAQREEWVRLFSIDEIKADLTGQVAYSKSLSLKFLKASPYLVLDTRFFKQKFKDTLLAAIGDVDQNINGILINGDNFHALSLMESGYRDRVSCIYVDPPYNTGSDGFPYKDSYQHSSWLASIADRMRLARLLLANSKPLFMSIDDNEMHNAIHALEVTWGGNFLATLARRTKSGGGSAANYFAVEHDYVIAWARSKDEMEPLFVPHDPEYAKRYAEKDDNGRYFWDTMERSSTATTPYKIKAPDGTLLEGRWFRSEERFKEDLKNGEVRLLKKDDGTWSVQFKQRMGDGRKIRSLLYENEYKSSQSELDVLGLFNFPHPKPVRLLRELLQSISGQPIILDFFAGSGTTGHAIINLNRVDRRSRRYILVEMGSYFDTTLTPRIMKVIYSKEWKDGKPVDRHSGVSHMFKYLRLESYEDALTNLCLNRTESQQKLLNKSDSFRESYMLKYMLDVETKDSPSLLNIDRFDDPFSYQLLVGTGSVGETKPVNVDLVETFNWLLGLKVKHLNAFDDFTVVEGINPKGEKVLVIWRKVRDITEKDSKKIEKQREKANEALETFFKKQQYNTMDMEYDIVYVNGDNNLMNVPVTPEGEGREPRYKVRLIEEEFKRLMFDVKDI